MMRVPRGDTVLAAALAVAVAGAALLTGPAQPLLRAGAGVVPLALMAVAVRQRRPGLAAAAVAVVVVVEVVAAPEGSSAPAFLALMVAAYSLGAHAAPGPAAAGIVVCLAAVVVGHLLAPFAGYSHAGAITFLSLLLVVGPVMVGLLVRLQRGHTRRLRGEASALREAAPAVLAALREEERRRVGGDIDRLVVDGLAAMRSHAAAASLDDVVALRDLGRAMLARMRALLAELRSDAAEEIPLLPGHPVGELRAHVGRVLGQISAYVDVPVASGPGPGPGPVAGIRRWPAAMTTLVLLLAAMFFAITGADPLAGVVAGAAVIGIPLLASAAAARPVQAGAVLVLATAYPFAVVAAFPGRGSDLAEAAQAAMVVVGVWAAGRVVRACGTALADSARAARDEASRQRTELREALETDRAHVARELHDAVGHAMTTVVMLATAAVRVWDSEPRLAAEHCVALRATLAEALDELGPLLESVARRGARDLSAVPALIERARAGGQRLSLRIDAPAVVDPDDGAVVYRLVQEALTNAARHAPGAAVHVYIGCSGRELTVRVANDCAGPPAADGGGGQGLRGMAERATSRGGTLRAGPVADGFLVEAVIPARAAG